MWLIGLSVLTGFVIGLVLLTGAFSFSLGKSFSSQFGYGQYDDVSEYEPHKEHAFARNVFIVGLNGILLMIASVVVGLVFVPWQTGAGLVILYALWRLMWK